ncbi:hypothetical protein [Priestia flexa]|nr:hypothetical protein [Priestia flexa]
MECSAIERTCSHCLTMFEQSWFVFEKKSFSYVPAAVFIAN